MPLIPPEELFRKEKERSLSERGSVLAQILDEAKAAFEKMMAEGQAARKSGRPRKNPVPPQLMAVVEPAPKKPAEKAPVKAARLKAKAKPAKARRKPARPAARKAARKPARRATSSKRPKGPAKRGKRR